MNIDLKSNKTKQNLNLHYRILNVYSVDYIITSSSYGFWIHNFAHIESCRNHRYIREVVFASVYYITYLYIISKEEKYYLFMNKTSLQQIKKNRFTYLTRQK